MGWVVLFRVCCEQNDGVVSAVQPIKTYYNLVLPGSHLTAQCTCLLIAVVGSPITAQPPLCTVTTRITLSA